MAAEMDPVCKHLQYHHANPTAFSRELVKNHYFNSNDPDKFMPLGTINMRFTVAFTRMSSELDDQYLMYNKFANPTARQCECWNEELLAESTMVYTAANCATTGSKCIDGEWDAEIRRNVEKKCGTSRVVDDWRATFGYGIAQYREGALDKFHWSNLITDYLIRREARFHDRDEFVMLDVERYKRGNPLAPKIQSLLDASRLNPYNLK